MTSPINTAQKYDYSVPDMSCNHCVKTITQHIHQKYPEASVSIDLPKHRVSVSGDVNADTVLSVIREAGYQPQVI